MISRKNRFIYIHVPKTGGNSIQVALKPFAESEFRYATSAGWVWGDNRFNGYEAPTSVQRMENFWVIDPAFGDVKHWSLKQYSDCLGSEIRDYRIISSVRNPFDWSVSLYFFRKQACRSDGYSWIRRSSDVAPDMFDSVEYLDFLHSGEPPQSAYLRDASVDQPIRLIRYESIESDFESICDEIGVQPSVRLPHINRSRRAPWQQVLGGHGLIEQTRLVFKEDFERFGYSRDCERGQ